MRSRAGWPSSPKNPACIRSMIFGIILSNKFRNKSTSIPYEARVTFGKTQKKLPFCCSPCYNMGCNEHYKKGNREIISYSLAGCPPDSQVEHRKTCQQIRHRRTEVLADKPRCHASSRASHACEMSYGDMRQRKRAPVETASRQARHASSAEHLLARQQDARRCSCRRAILVYAGRHA